VNNRLTVAAGLATVLASIALYPLVAGGGWFWGGIGAVAVAGAIGAATRRRMVPAWICFLAAVVGEFLYLNILFARKQSWVDVVPTVASVHHLSLLVTQAMTETRHSPPPVPPRPGIELVIVAGIGLVGILTDLLAVRLHRPAIAGLPLLVLFCVPLTTPVKLGAVGTALAFCVGVAGYLGLLSADSRYRLRLWGTVIHPWREEGENIVPDTSLLAATGRRIGTAAVVLALFLPLLMPAVRAQRLFGGPGGGVGGPGQGPQGPVSLPRPLDLLNTDLQETHPRVVLTYSAADEGTPPYLQVYVLGDLTPSGWSMARPTGATALGSGGALPRPAGLAAGTSGLGVDESITLASGLSSGANTSYLPLPYPARQVRVGAGSWRVDPGSLTVHSTDARLAGLHYTVIGREPTPSPQQLRRAGQAPATLDPYLLVPPAFDRLQRLLRTITKGKTSLYDKAAAIQAWFHQPGLFTYSLTARSGTLVQFLTETKTGSCQQFAFGMAVLARLAGIPSRVVIGFTQGSYVRRNIWQVKTSDAHAWPELYFNGAGWLEFEPTPPNQFGPAGQGTATIPAYSDPQQFPGGATTPQTGQKQNNPGLAQAGHGHSSGRLPGKVTSPLGGSSGPAASHQGGSAPIGAIVIVLLAALLLTPGLTRVIARRWRWRNAHDDMARAHVAWRELCDDLADHRIARQASESPRALARRITESLGLSGAEREALARVARAEERASYAASPADSARLRADVALVRRAVVRATRLPARWSARVAPSSALAPARAGLHRAVDALVRMELAVAGAVAHAFRRRAPHGT
jgi:TgpA N-terminal domain/Transglutaminase-like superfamily/Domain of unknown function (DUF4129)